jgi:GNAT superfamily N-acetyltransferase
MEATPAQEAQVRARPSSAGHPIGGPLVQVTCYVALRRGTLVGWAYLQQSGQEAVMPGYMLGGVYVRRRWRGAGFGRLLAGRVIEEAWRQGAESVALWASDRNTAALALYRDLGFTLDVAATASRRRQPRASSAVRHLCVLRVTRSV